VAVGEGCVQEIRVRFGRDDKVLGDYLPGHWSVGSTRSAKLPFSAACSAPAMAHSALHLHGKEKAQGLKAQIFVGLNGPTKAVP